MRELALFAGAGGGLLASKLLGWKTVCYVEKDAFCVQVIKARIQEKILDDAPIWDDVRSFDGRPWRGCVDIVSAGFPCQPFSSSGKRKAGDDPRNMWLETARVIREVAPRFALLENVSGLLYRPHGYIRRVLQDLAEIGYDARWDCFPAGNIGAPHQRDRLWIVAYTSKVEPNRIFGHHPPIGDLGKQRTPGKRSYWNGIWVKRPREAFIQGLLPPGITRVDDGLAGRVDRLGAIGNGQVPQVAALVWKAFTVDVINGRR